MNVLSPLHAQVYFPTYSNSLKDIARYLGYRWSDANASGLHALMWRSEWETSHDPNLKRKLISYTAEDCEAAQRVAEAVTAICSEQESEAPEPSTSVNVESLGREHPRLFGCLRYSRPECKRGKSRGIQACFAISLFRRAAVRVRRVPWAAQPQQPWLRPARRAEGQP